MLQMSLGEVLKYKGNNVSYRIYAVRDEEVYLYIGQSVNVIHRLKSHIQRGKVNSVLGILFHANRERARGWTAELYTVEELGDIIHQWREERVQQEIERIKHYSLPAETIASIVKYYREVGCRSILDAPLTVDNAEAVMIVRHSPCLNIEWNCFPTPLPNRYNTQLTVHSRHPYPWNIPAKFHNQFTLISKPLVAHEGNVHE